MISALFNPAALVPDPGKYVAYTCKVLSCNRSIPECGTVRIPRELLLCPFHPPGPWLLGNPSHPQSAAGEVRRPHWWTGKGSPANRMEAESVAL